MANGFVCTQCGWQESYHFPKNHVTYEEEDIELMHKPLLGFAISLARCNGYTLSEEEIARDEKFGDMTPQVGSHEGQH